MSVATVARAQGEFARMADEIESLLERLRVVADELEQSPAYVRAEVAQGAEEDPVEELDDEAALVWQVVGDLGAEVLSEERLADVLAGLRKAAHRRTRPVRQAQALAGGVE